jgi:hypothetical protein
MLASKQNKEPRCSFCYQLQSRVKMMVAGRAGGFICSECVAFTYDVLVKQGAIDPARRQRRGDQRQNEDGR